MTLPKSLPQTLRGSEAVGPLLPRKVPLLKPRWLHRFVNANMSNENELPSKL